MNLAGSIGRRAAWRVASATRCRSLKLIEFFYLPGHRPELNPEERLNVYLKRAIGTKVPMRAKAKPRSVATEHMVKLENPPGRGNRLLPSPAGQTCGLEPPASLGRVDGFSAYTFRQLAWALLLGRNDSDGLQMKTRSNRTMICSVVFLDIVNYSAKTVSEQISLKELFNECLVESLRPVPAADRIVLDTGDGAAISFLGNPDESLLVAVDLNERFAASEQTTGLRLDVRIGINLGPARLMTDVNGQLNVVGDGINVAQRVMTFARPGTVLVSRSFYEVVSRLADDYAVIFRHEGAHTDKHVREHDVYSVGDTTGLTAKRRPVRARALVLEALRHHPGLVWFSRLRRHVVVPTIGAAFLIIGAGWLWREFGATKPMAAPPAPLATAPAPVDGRAKPKLVPLGALSALASRGTSAPVQDAAPPPGTLKFVIRPWGEVFVDGQSRGVSPPLKTLSLAPGKHKVEVRNSRFPPLVKKIDIKSGAELTLQHTFR